MKFQPLESWTMGNESITPENFYGSLKPYLELGAYISLDIAVDLYLANTVDTRNLQESWNRNKEYIEKVCELTRTD